jgi:hypothetical protein
MKTKSRYIDLIQSNRRHSIKNNLILKLLAHPFRGIYYGSESLVLREESSLLERDAVPLGISPQNTWSIQQRCCC